MPQPSTLTLVPRARRIVMTGGLALATWGVVRSDPGPATHGRGLVILVALVVGALAWAIWVIGRVPDRVMFVVLCLFAASGGLLTAAAPNGPSSAFAFVAVISTAIRYGGTRQIVTLVLAVVTLAAGAIVYDEATGVIAYSAGFLAAMSASAARRTSILRTEEAELLLAQVQRSREEQLRAAALDERARIAREIHDVLAHSLAGLTIDLEATRMLLEQGADADRVLARVDRARSLAQEGLVETRRAVEALRGDHVRVGEQLAAMTRELRESTASDATLITDGDVDDLPADAALAIVRVTQESLTNVRKHAPGAAVEIEARRDGRGVTLRVTSRAASSTAVVSSAAASAATDLAASGGGYGLQGMRERAEMVGGRLEAGPTGDGWRVELRIPVATGAV